MKRRKRKLTAAALIAVLLALCVQASLAYYTVRGTATNVVTSGGVQMQIHETTDNGKPFPREGISVIPGDVVTKKVFIENISGHPFWLRVQLVWGDDSHRLVAEDVLQIMDLNETEWIAHEGYYYYHIPLQPEKSTEPLFEKVHLVGALVDQYDIGTALTISVKASAVQSENNPAANPWEASGWPAA